MGQRHSGWARTYSGERTSSGGSSEYRPASKQFNHGLSSDQLRAAMRAADAGSAPFDEFIKTLPPRDEVD